MTNDFEKLYETLMEDYIPGTSLDPAVKEEEEVKASFAKMAEDKKSTKKVEEDESDEKIEDDKEAPKKEAPKKEEPKKIEKDEDEKEK